MPASGVAPQIFGQRVLLATPLHPELVEDALGTVRGMQPGPPLPQLHMHSPGQGMCSGYRCQMRPTDDYGKVGTWAWPTCDARANQSLGPAECRAGARACTRECHTCTGNLQACVQHVVLVQRSLPLVPDACARKKQASPTLGARGHGRRRRGAKACHLQTSPHLSERGVPGGARDPGLPHGLRWLARQLQGRWQHTLQRWRGAVTGQEMRDDGQEQSATPGIQNRSSA